MSYGYIKLHRKIQKWEFYFQEPFNRPMAWIDLLLLANYKDNNIRIRGILIKLKRGQMAYSIESLAKRWQRNRKTVMAWLNEFKLDNMLDTKKTNVTTIITIINYNQYQDSLDNETDTKTDSRLDTKTDTNNNSKERRIMNKNKKPLKDKVQKIIFPDWIDKELWNDYVKMRIKIRKPLTNKAIELAIEKLTTLKNEGQNINKVLQQSIFNSWQGLFPFKLDQSDKFVNFKNWLSKKT
jgi:glycyl-tRNA synthetase beta subunit